MSRIQGKPYIETLLAGLTDAQKAALIGLLNGSSSRPTLVSLINPSRRIDRSDNGVHHRILETGKGDYTGYLIRYSDEDDALTTALIAYRPDGAQDLDILRIDESAQTFEIVPEPLTITELRFELEEAHEPADIVATVNDAMAEGTIPAPAAAIEVGDIDMSLTDGNEFSLDAGQYAIAVAEGPCYLKVQFDDVGSYPIEDQADLPRVSVGSGEAYFAGFVEEGGSTYRITAHVDPNGDGSVEIGEIGGGAAIPTVTIELSQVTSQNPLQIQLTQAQWDVFDDNYQVIIDGTALGVGSVMFYKGGWDSVYEYHFASKAYGAYVNHYDIEFNSTTLEATITGHNSRDMVINPMNVGNGNDADAGKILKMDSDGMGILSNGLPYIDCTGVSPTYPSSANTDGLIIVLCSSEPPAGSKLSGYLYLVA